ncbi:hypothetical protein HMPREF0578_0387 [Mobiluncus mulieris 28-1]|nr:hypothetical protein HMPREF0578_0387 [Mobiluncus mulieris 28-1]
MGTEKDFCLVFTKFRTEPGGCPPGSVFFMRIGHGALGQRVTTVSARTGSGDTGVF